MLTLIAVKSGKEKRMYLGNKEIRTNCVLSITHKEISFIYEGYSHTVKYNETKKGNYFLLRGKRYYFKVWDNYENKWLIDCNCF